MKKPGWCLVQNSNMYDTIGSLRPYFWPQNTYFREKRQKKRNEAPEKSYNIEEFVLSKTVLSGDPCGGFE